jgi:hypothetical protein
LNKTPRNRIIGVGCVGMSGFGFLGGTVLKDSLPYSGIIGWSLGVILSFCAIFFLVNRHPRNKLFSLLILRCLHKISLCHEAA